MCAENSMYKKFCLWTKSTLRIIGQRSRPWRKLYVIDNDKALYQDQGQIMWKSTLWGSSLWTWDPLYQALTQVRIIGACNNSLLRKGSLF